MVTETLTISRFRRNLNSVLRRLSSDDGPEVVLVERRGCGVQHVVFPAETYYALKKQVDDLRFERLKYIVPVYTGEYCTYVKVSDIPNPWRSEFCADSEGSTCPLIAGEGECHYSWDWEKWLRIRASENYRPRHGQIPRYISDSEARRPITLRYAGAACDEDDGGS